ncbi:hypothetical protein niasHS_009244 [Heterodera schachtii]|uniref:UDP-glucose:glycoprotein glucosyltransferase n=1 Tax=Heterodera schachtii TaxID=97005 RepID=A0ABD2J5F3_HETSC
MENRRHHRPQQKASSPQIVFPIPISPFSSWRLPQILLLLLLATFLGHANATADAGPSATASSAMGSKLVTASLDANWAHTSLVAETSEFFASADNSAFWRFIDALLDEQLHSGNGTGTTVDSSSTTAKTVATHEAELDMALASAAAAAQLRHDDDSDADRESDEDGGGGELQLLRFALALRLHSPRVHLHRQIARDVLRRDGAGEAAPAQFKHFYEINGAVGFEVAQLDGLSTDSLIDGAKQRHPSVVYSVDHVYPTTNGGANSAGVAVVAVLYADIGSPDANFRALHRRFAQLATDGHLVYVLRHFDQNDQKAVPAPVSLSGYGVELAIKSTEYKAIDDSNDQKTGGDEPAQNLHGFNFSLLREKYAHLRDNLRQFQLHLAELDELSPLKQWEIADIDLQAAQRVMDASPEEALVQLTDLSQNFPIRARSLVQTKVRQSFRDEVAQNQKRWAEQMDMSEGESALFLNGIPIAMGEDVERLDMAQLFNTMRQEQQLAQAFVQMGLRRDYQPILHLMDLSEEKPGAYALDYREANPEWLNNLDKDKQYSEWGNSVRLLLQPYFPGMMRPIARNLFTLVCVLEPGSPASWPLFRMAHSLFLHQVPLRIGFVFVLNDSSAVNGLNDLGHAIHNVYQFVKMDKGPAGALLFLKKMLDQIAPSTGSAATDKIVADVHAYFLRHHTDQEVADVFGPDSDYAGGGTAGTRTDGTAFFRRSGLQRLPALLVNGVPLDNALLQSDDRMEEGIMVAVMRQTGALQRAVMTGKLTDRENVQNWVLSQPDVLPRLNGRLLGGTKGGAAPSSKPMVGGSGGAPPLYTSEQCATGAESGKGTTTEQRTACVLATLRYLQRADESAAALPCWLTVWTVADLDTADGRKLVANALKGMKKSNAMRLAVLHNGKADPSSSNSVSVLIDALLHGLSSTAAKQSLNKLFAADQQQLMDEVHRNGPESVLDKIGGHGVNLDPVRSELKNAAQRLRAQAQFARSDLGLAQGQRAVLVNGQLHGPLDADEQLEPEDFVLLERLAEKRGAKAVAALVHQWKSEGREGLVSADSAGTVFRILSAVNAHAVRRRRQTVNNEVEYESAMTLLADLEDERRPVLEFSAIVAPLSRAAQKLAPLLRTLLQVVNADLRLAMNPKQRLSELPLKRFYRYVLRAELAFDAAGSVVPNVAQFRELPQQQLLTLNLIVPDPWMVQPMRAEHDLDNIRVASASKDIVAVFQLRHILLDGHCFEDPSGNPPRGLQFVLGTRAEPALFDTIVMANLGYFQLKAGPGAWILRLRDGRSKQIYALKSSVDAENIGIFGQTEASANGGGQGGGEDDVEELHVLVDSFSGRTIRVRVEKRKGMERKSLLSEEKDPKQQQQATGAEDGTDAVDELDEEEAEEDEDNSIWSNLAPKKVVKKLSSKLMGTGQSYDRINIFSLASGHLYERFLRIMMLSVLKNTKHPVKFWLLNNYLSPQFRESLPVMASHYGFDYQLIEYKWPSWLHQQTEKQRVMWGYKILFLDVLFPLDVKKIIFVDADQIVRTDLMQLMEHDLEGAPYGYTPFCDSRKSMDGFRFWRSGYWAQHLAGRKYHISALYVVDLVKFRQIAAGDRLRGQYQGLSSDPNSLSNLDQDLPNNMIHQVRIHSLPQEWLWCETWCDDVSKDSAKTIDLCNNPLTKEPKLDSAVRIVSEWTELDNEIKRLLTSSSNNRIGVGKPQDDETAPDDDEKHEEL